MAIPVVIAFPCLFFLAFYPQLKEIVSPVPPQEAGDRWFEKGDYDRALAAYDKAESRGVRNYQLFANRGWLRIKRNEYDLALADLDAAIAFDASQPDSFANRGWIRANRKEHDLAIRDFNEAIQLQPRNAAALCQRGCEWIELKEWDKALADLDAAISLYPEGIHALLNRATIRNHRKNYRDAVSDCDAALRLDRKSAYAHGSRAFAYMKLGKYTEALADYEDSLTLDPMDWIQSCYAFFLSTCPDKRFRNGGKALTLAKSAIEKAGKNPDWEYKTALAAALAETGDFDGAVREQKAALAHKSMDEVDRAEQEKRLKLYEAKKPYRDE